MKSRLYGLLAERHKDALFVPECLMGQGGTHILDGWALLPTWSPITTVGYEVKADRGDWLRDQKWPVYLPCAHLFYVAAEKGVVKREELPPGVGLLEATGYGTGARLLTKVKATRREPDPDQLMRLMIHVLMWRVRVDHRRNTPLDKGYRVQAWREFVDGRKDWNTIGRSVGEKMRAIVDEALKARRLAEAKAETLSEAAAILKELRIDTSTRYNVGARIEQAVRRSAAAVREVDDAISALTVVRERLQAAQGDQG